MTFSTLSATRTLSSKDAAQRLCGPLDINLKQAEQKHGVRVELKGLELIITGPAAQQALADLVALETTTTKAHTRPGRGPATPRTPGQHDLHTALRTHPLVLANGPAGSGKTRLSVDRAVELLSNNLVDRIILTRPAIEAGERLGFLPGDMKDKVDPYMQPLYDCLAYHYDAKTLKALMDDKIIEIAPVAFMRGRTLQQAAVVVDEAQNLTHEQTKMMITRIGEGATMVLVGDTGQIDLPHPDNSGLAKAMGMLEGVEGIGTITLTAHDCVRSPLVGRILRAYGIA